MTEEIHQITGLTRSAINAVLSALPEVVSDKLAEGKQVKINRLGSFSMKHVKERFSYLPNVQKNIHAHETPQCTLSHVLRKTAVEKKQKKQEK